MTIAKAKGAWKLPDSDNFPADSRKVEQFLTRLKGFKQGVPVANSEEARKRFKVSDKSFERRITLAEGAKPLATLFVGTPAGRESHVREADDKTVHLVQFNPYDAPAKAEDWEDKTVLQIPKDQIVAIEANGMELERAPKIDQVKSTKPDKETAATSVPVWQAGGSTSGTLKADAADKLAKMLAELRIGSVLGKDDQPGYGLKTPKLTLSVKRKSGERLTYRIGKMPNKEDYVLKVSGRDEYFELPTYTAEPLIQAAKPDILFDGDGQVGSVLVEEVKKKLRLFTRGRPRPSDALGGDGVSREKRHATFRARVAVGAQALHQRGEVLRGNVVPLEQGEAEGIGLCFEFARVPGLRQQDGNTSDGERERGYVAGKRGGDGGGYRVLNDVPERMAPLDVADLVRQDGVDLVGGFGEIDHLVGDDDDPPRQRERVRSNERRVAKLQPQLRLPRETFGESGKAGGQFLLSILIQLRRLKHPLLVEPCDGLVAEVALVFERYALRDFFRQHRQAVDIAHCNAGDGDRERGHRNRPALLQPCNEALGSSFLRQAVEQRGIAALKLRAVGQLHEAIGAPDARRNADLVGRVTLIDVGTDQFHRRT